MSGFCIFDLYIQKHNVMTKMKTGRGGGDFGRKAAGMNTAAKGAGKAAGAGKVGVTPPKKTTPTTTKSPAPTKPKAAVVVKSPAKKGPSGKTVSMHQVEIGPGGERNRKTVTYKDTAGAVRPPATVKITKADMYKKR